MIKPLKQAKIKSICCNTRLSFYGLKNTLIVWCTNVNFAISSVISAGRNVCWENLALKELARQLS